MLVFKVEGMMCPRCQKRVEDAARNVHGVREVTADHRSGTLRVEGVDVSPVRITDAVVAAGYAITLVSAD